MARRGKILAVSVDGKESWVEVDYDTGTVWIRPGLDQDELHNALLQVGNEYVSLRCNRDA